jgi:hypothetical protein
MPLNFGMQSHLLKFCRSGSLLITLVTISFQESPHYEDAHLACLNLRVKNQLLCLTVLYFSVVFG